MIAEEATCPVCNNGLSAHEDGHHPPYVERCFLCRRETEGDEVLVTLDGKVRGVCSTCFERGEEGIRIPLDMTEDDDFDNREGQPEFNGAFR